MNSFDTFPLRPETRAALTTMTVSIPTPIQEAALPLMLDGKDVIGQARTGSGKTLAFALPMVEHIDERRNEVQALVLVPTRELAAQVAGVVRETAGRRNLRVLLLIGGASIGPQRQALLHGVHVVAGTPGRILDHIKQGNLRLGKLRLLVLDEADEMLDRGFAPDVERIISYTNPERQTALFSATLPDWVDSIAAKHLHQPIKVRIDARDQPVEHVPHAVYDVPDGGKLGALRTLLDARGAGVTLVFGRTKHGVKKLARQLETLGYPVGALQGNLSQNARDRVMEDFRSGETPILIATNVAARGLDIEHVAQVINYELPETAGLLTHRVGRTGRMGRSGEAITLLTSDDEAAWNKLLRELPRHPVRRPWRGGHQPVDLPRPAVSEPASVPTRRSASPAAATHMVRPSVPTPYVAAQTQRRVEPARPATPGELALIGRVASAPRAREATPFPAAGRRENPAPYAANRPVPSGVNVLSAGPARRRRRRGPSSLQRT